MEWKSITEVDDLTADQRVLVKEHLARAFEVAAHMVRKCAYLDEGAARTAAFNALTQAVRGYQEQRGEFWPFARCRVTGAILDLLRGAPRQVVMDLELLPSRNDNNPITQLMIQQASDALRPQNVPLTAMVLAFMTAMSVRRRLRRWPVSVIESLSAVTRAKLADPRRTQSTRQHHHGWRGVPLIGLRHSRGPPVSGGMPADNLSGGNRETGERC